ncbi:MAG: AAA family ATPase [Opitutales bacterium]
MSRIEELIEDLARPEAYRHAVEAVQVMQTHISLVFLAGEYAYKLKKPVDLGFLDYGSLEKRAHFCREEVRLNRRLASDVYLGVVSVVRKNGRLRMEEEGEPVEYAVKMRWLPPEARLEAFLERGALDASILEKVARKIAGFHREARSTEEGSRWGAWKTVAGNVRENFEQTRDQVGVCVHAAVFDRLRELTEKALAAHKGRIAERAKSGWIRDTHGDLRLEHIYYFPEKSPPDELVVLDCIEFNERFRFADPVSDMAFLCMDLDYHNRRDLRNKLADDYFRELADEAGRKLLPFYTSYRAGVRAKVSGLKAKEEEIPEAEREKAVRKARGHWLVALAALSSPEEKPCLVLMGGLPATGKTTLAKELGDEADMEMIRSDVVRKELAGLEPRQAAAAPYESELYTPEWTARTYEACRKRAAQCLFEGRRVIVDASFKREDHRRLFLDLAADYAVGSIMFECRTSEEEARRRLQDREDDASDATWEVYKQAAGDWEPYGRKTKRHLHLLPVNGSPEKLLEDARCVLRSQACGA